MGHIVLFSCSVALIEASRYGLEQFVVIPSTWLPGKRVCYEAYFTSDFFRSQMKTWILCVNPYLQDLDDYQINRLWNEFPGSYS